MIVFQKKKKDDNFSETQGTVQVWGQPVPVEEASVHIIARTLCLLTVCRLTNHQPVGPSLFNHSIKRPTTKGSAFYFYSAACWPYLMLAN